MFGCVCGYMWITGNWSFISVAPTSVFQMKKLSVWYRFGLRCEHVYVSKTYFHFRNDSFMRSTLSRHVFVRLGVTNACFALFKYYWVLFAFVVHAYSVPVCIIFSVMLHVPLCWHSRLETKKMQKNIHSLKLRLNVAYYECCLHRNCREIHRWV